MTRTKKQLLRRLGRLRGKIPRDVLLAIRAQILRGETLFAARGIDQIERRLAGNEKAKRF